jgi:ElaB/YqjD/DUF883 family membrane-anchored ribosome-binding protein
LEDLDMAEPSPTTNVDPLERPNDLTQPVAMAKELANEAVQDAKDAVDQVRYQSELLSHSPGVAGDIARFTRKRPFEALLIAAAFAFTIGAIWKR